MSADDDPVITEHKMFRSTGIDLRKLRQQKEWRLILRMLRVFNDISFAPAVSFLMRFAPNDGELKPIHDAVDWHLMRWRLSMAAEAMKNVIEPLQAHEGNHDHEVWRIIRSTAGLPEEWTRLKEYFSNGKYQEEKRRAQVVRDRLFAHYDQAPINCAFEKLLTISGSSDKATHIGWHLQSSGDDGQISRNVLLDELLNLAWYELYEIDVNAEGPDERQLTVAGDSLIQFLKLVANFVNGVVISYCEGYNLTTIDGRPPWLDNRC